MKFSTFNKLCLGTTHRISFIPVIIIIILVNQVDTAELYCKIFVRDVDYVEA